MDEPTRTDRELWLAEAVGAVLDNERWMCLTAGISPGGASFFAVYRMRLTGARRTVTLPCYRARSFTERRQEIRRRLGIARATDIEAPGEVIGVRRSAGATNRMVETFEGRSRGDRYTLPIPPNTACSR